MRNLGCLIIICLLVVLSIGNSHCQTIKLFTASATNTNGFVLVQPTTYTTAKKYQLYVFLHGVGGRGNGSNLDLGKLTGGELPKNLQAAAEKDDFVIVAPQIGGDWSVADVNNVVTWARANLSIDWGTNRNVITGLSLGGGGVWRYISSSIANAQNFATAIPICGLNWNSSSTTIAQSKIAIWAFHSTDDGIVGYNNSKMAVDNVNAAGPMVPAYLTTYNTGNHYIWERVYDTEVRPGVLNEIVDIYEYARLNKVGAPAAIPTQGPVNGLVADAGPDLKVTTETVNLNGLNSRGFTSAKWTVAAVPSGVNPWGVNGCGWITCVSKLPKAGVYTFRLSITNAAGQTQTDDVNITYDNGTPPTTPDKKVVNCTTSVENGLIVVTITFSDGTTSVIK